MLLWIVLQISLLVLQYSQIISNCLLVIAIYLGFRSNVLDWRAISFIFTIVTISFFTKRCLDIDHSNSIHCIIMEVIIVLSSVALMLHIIPGFHSVRVIDSFKLGPLSAPYTMNYNFDKSLLPFLLLICEPSLFIESTSISNTTFNKWIILACSIPLVLFIGVYCRVLKIEIHTPSKRLLLQYISGNLFFTSLAEEAFFRGYLQRKFAYMTSHAYPILEVLLSSFIFCLAHFAGGPALMLFSGLAGLIYSTALLWSGKLWVSVLYHFGLNIFHFLFFTYPYLKT